MSNSHLSRILFFAMVIGVIQVCLGQSTKDKSNYSRHSIYAEGLGQGIVYSVNYDYRVKEYLSIRAGATTWFIPGAIFLMDGKVRYYSLLFMGNYLTGNGTQHFEIGAGLMPAYVSFTGKQLFWGEEINEHKLMLLYTATVGYRLQQEHGLLFRIGLTPIGSIHGIALLAGISFGAAF